ncbi:MAG TPA: hypothetical protein VNZ53_32710, partial [Steroidobacteraceae bacterium]|nr:hypothetical protein [Steroidobacteraceae bacterium]
LHSNFALEVPAKDRKIKSFPQSGRVSRPERPPPVCGADAAGFLFSQSQSRILRSAHHAHHEVERSKVFEKDRQSG